MKGINTSLLYFTFLLSFFSFAQLKKSTVSIAGGEVRLNSQIIYYAVGQSSMVGQNNLENKKLINGFINPINKYKNYTRLPVEWSVYPNPFKEKFIVQFPFDINDANVYLYNLKGSEMYSKIEYVNHSSIQISQLEYLSSSSYLLVIEHQGIIYKRHILHINEK